MCGNRLQQQMKNPPGLKCWIMRMYFFDAEFVLKRDIWQLISPKASKKHQLKSTWWVGAKE